MISGKKFNAPSASLTVLIAPLDWGLGHATRCIPIINYLISNEINVIISASDAGFFLLKKDFPQLTILPIKGYKIYYSRRKSNLPFTLLFQLPKIFITILKEHIWLKKLIKKNNIDAVISDNRPGMFSKKIVSVYITHQLLIKTGNSFTEALLKKVHHFFIKKFNYCWVPDYKETGLAGELSHPQKLPPNTEYLGLLSRFQLLQCMPQVYDVAILISGPEPQRKIFESIILSQLQNFKKKVLLVRGLPEENLPIKNQNDLIEIHNHLSTAEINKKLLQSKLVIARSGYSTVMDLFKISSNAVLVPTPGQTEQEYLAKYLMEKKYFYSISQDAFLIHEAIEKAETFSFNKVDHPIELYKNVLDEFVQLLKTKKFAPQ